MTNKMSFVESDKNPVGQFDVSKGISSPVMIEDQDIPSLQQVHEILSKPCPNVVPYNFAPLIDNWQELSRVRVTDLKSSEESTDTRMSLHKPRLIELASYPGYEKDTPTSLPFNLRASDITNDVINSQARLRGKLSFADYCRSNLEDWRMRNILLDLFWWVFLDSFERNKSIQEMLFVRIATNFGNFFSGLPREKNFKDRFLQILPDILSQTVFTLFIYSYSTSWKQFDEAFKSRICNLIHFWFSGLPPFPNSWKNWPLDKLLPETILHRTSIDMDIPTDEKRFSPSLDSRQQKGASSQSQTRVIVPKKFLLKKSPESHQIGPSYGFQRSLFRTSGHCPLMDYYLAKKDIVLPPSHSVLLTRSNILPSPYTTNITYHDFMQRYNKRAQARRNKMFEIMRKTNEAISRRRVEQERENNQPSYAKQVILENKEEEKYLRQRGLPLADQKGDYFLLEAQAFNEP